MPCGKYIGKNFLPLGNVSRLGLSFSSYSRLEIFIYPELQSLKKCFWRGYFLLADLVVLTVVQKKKPFNCLGKFLNRIFFKKSRSSEEFALLPRFYSENEKYGKFHCRKLIRRLDGVENQSLFSSVCETK